MPTFELQGPDGKTYDVEAPSIDAAVGAFKQFSGAPQQPEPAPAPVDPRRQKAEDEVRAYRAANPTTTMVDDTVRRLARGTGVGSWLDEGNARLSSILPEALGGRPYEDAIEIERAKDRVGDAESTVVGSLPIIGDVSAGGLTKLAGAVASAPVTPAIRAFQGATLLPRIGNAAITGGALGGVYGAGEGETTSERGGNALLGLGLGTILGAAAPVAESAVSNTVSAVRNRLQPLPAALQGYERSAVNRVGDVARMDDLTQPGYRAEAGRLGQQGMLADMGENLTMVTEGLAQQPGPQRRIIAGALEDRAEGAGQRINNALNAEVGPAINVPQYAEHMTRLYGQRAAPLYDQFYSSNIPMTPTLNGLLRRANSVGAVGRAQRLMAAEGADPRVLRRLVDDEMTPMTGVQDLQRTRVPNGQELDYIKRGIDDLANAAEQGSNEQRIYRDLARRLRTEVDTILSPNDPAQSVWAQARQIAGDGIRTEDAIDAGTQAFGRGQTADQMAADLGRMSGLEQDAYRVGAREQLRRTMDNSATNFRASGDAAARRTLNSPENQRKLETIAGPQNAANVMRRVGAENTMADTAGTVLGNSATARRQVAREMIPRQYDASSMREMRGTSLTGLAMEGAGRLANVLTAGALNERNSRIAHDMADMLVAQGATRDQIAQAIIARVQGQNLNQAQSQAIGRFVRDLIRGSAAPAISDQASQ
jgi:hypothetical protein